MTKENGSWWRASSWGELGEGKGMKEKERKKDGWYEGGKVCRTVNGRDGEGGEGQEGR